MQEDNHLFQTAIEIMKRSPYPLALTPWLCEYLEKIGDLKKTEGIFNDYGLQGLSIYIDLRRYGSE